MDQKNKLRKGILLGALAGGLISLLDKNTRVATINNCRNCFNKVKTVVQDPNVVIDEVKDVTSRAKNSISQITDDIIFISEKVNELKEVSPQVVNIVQETKGAFESDKTDA